MATWVQQPIRDGTYRSSLVVGDEERTSAKQRRQNQYKEDLQLQMRERDAARQRERLQDMSVNASGYLDPEKGPDRLKPLGGVDWTQYRTRDNSRVKPYHTLFLYDEQRRRSAAPATHIPEVGRIPVESIQLDPIVVERPNLGKLNLPPELHYQPVSYGAAPTSFRAPGNSFDDAYSFYASRDIQNMGTVGNLVQPLQPIHHHDTRPIIIQGGTNYEWQGPRYNPFQSDALITSRFNSTLLEQERLKARLERENEEQRRRLNRELENGQRRIHDQELEARRRLDALRLESEERRREAERQRREWERLRRLKELERPKSIPIVVRPSSDRNKFLDEMDLYRRRLRDERKLIEELLMNRRPAEPAKVDIKVLRKQRPQEKPLTPEVPDDDNANPDNVHTFTELKHRDFKSRREFRNIFPEVPYTNKKLEWQQSSLLKQQEEALRELKNAKTDEDRQVIMKKYFFTRPLWMDRELTPFSKHYKIRHRLYTTGSVDMELDRVSKRRHHRLLSIDERLDPDSVLDNSKLHLRSHRPRTSDTLTDDTWLRPSSADV